ncbi:3,4-dihydroxy-2-butanone-4-phosphate synthase [Mycobacterium sp. pUA109]|uniref:3,4-dihydroxy-2-butanone-4-phosphate synthase n=1 Tax=Mycobacterium sp. pUA109 TaxID=3238982 RepID=UPI00351BE6AD
MLRLRARPHGVLDHVGPAEAGMDLCTLAGLRPAAVLAELIGPHGDLARDAQVFDFAVEHGLPVVTIDQVLAHRRGASHTVAARGEHDFSVAAAILRDLGVQRFRALVSAPVSGAIARDLGLDIVECIELSDAVTINASRRRGRATGRGRGPLAPAGSR